MRPVSRPRGTSSRANPRGGLRGSPQLRLRFGFIVIAMVLSIFGARLVQLQCVDPGAYAAMAAAEGTVTLDLPAERGDILDRNGKPLADSVDGEMVVANPEMTRAKAPELAKFLSSRLDIDYFESLKALRL
jgi:cell division protein FtsI (penicillin-binding protein 3)